MINNKKKKEDSGNAGNNFIVPTTEYYKPLTLKHSLVILIIINALVNLAMLIVYLIPELFNGEFILFIIPLFTVYLSYGAIKYHENCRAFNFFDDLQDIPEEKSARRNSGIQLIIVAYAAQIFNLFLSLLLVMAYLSDVYGVNIF